MKAAIRKLALELGFDVCRFTTAEPPGSAPQFQTWLERGWHGEMDYLARTANKRLDPRRVLAGARSVILLLASYSGDRNQPLGIGVRNPSNPASGAPGSNGAFQGIIARYACSGDYHQVLGAQLRKLTAYLDQIGGPTTRSLWYVDTGPLLERDLAQRAGAGFVGKHTNLISRGLGNWIFLAEIVTTLELEPDKPERNRCGSCARCIDACPTAAIRAPFQLDARRCISYLTIELKGAIPLELRPAIGNRIFGCDDCLAVCPWNRFAREGSLMKASMRPELATPDLVELLTLDEEGFKRRFAGTPMLRAKRQGLLRNVCVALGNTGDATTLPALQTAASDPQLLVAEHARWAIEQVQARMR